MKNFNLLNPAVPPTRGTTKKLLFISNTADEKERFYVFQGSKIGYKFWQDIYLKGKIIATLGAVNCIANDFADSKKIVKSGVTKKIIQLVAEAVKKDFLIFVLGASTKYVQNKLQKMFTNCIFLGGNELTATAIILQEKHFLNPDKNILILGGSTNLATLNAQLLQNFMPVDNIRPSARGDETELAKKFFNTPFDPVSFVDIYNGFRTKQLLNSIHISLLEVKDFKRLGVEICLEVARPTVYKNVCTKLNIRWAQLGIFEHQELTWEKELYDTKQHGLFACFLAGYIYSQYKVLDPVKALKLAMADGFTLQHIK